MPTTFYPPISSLITLDDLPNELDFIKDGLDAIFDKIYFRDLQYSINDRGDTGFYSLSIVSLNRMDIEIPGTGLFLILNPAHDPAVDDISEFPIILQYKWPVLGYLRNFDLATFSFEPGDFFDLALAVLDVSERELIDRVLNIFIDGANPVNTFVDDVNSAFGTAIPHPTSADPIDEVLTEIDSVANINGVGIAVFSIYLLDTQSDGNTKERFRVFFNSFYGGDFEGYLRELLIPKVNATLSISAAIEFPRNVLVPLDAVGGEPIADDNVKTMLLFDPGEFYFSTDRGIGFDDDLALTLSHPSEIGNTGFGFDFQNAKLDISRTKNIPEADRDGRPADFVGVYIEQASLTFPQFWNHDDANSTGIISGNNLIIGTGGFSGTLALGAKSGGDPAPFIKAKFGENFQISLDRFALTFQQNRITGSEIEGTLRLPGFKDANSNPADIRVKVDIGEDGDFDVTAYEDDGFKEIRFGNVFGITISSIFFGREDDDFYLGLSGCIRFLDPALAGILKGDFCVEELKIWSSGKLEIAGGTLPLPEGAKIKIGPAEIFITALHFGSHQQEKNGVMRKYNYFGFDGGISLNPGGVDARGDGIKFFYTADNGPGKPADSFLQIQSIAIDLVIPGDASEESATLLISGYLAIKQAGSGKRYEGGVKFVLPKAKIAGGAAMAYEPDTPAFIIDAFVEFSAPLILGSTGVGIWGFRGLFGHRYVATKQAAGLTDENTWFDYYKAPPEEGVVIPKFESPAATDGYGNPFSIGAGVTLATVADSGKAFSTKLFLMLSLPEVFFLEGKANILSERIGLTGDDPPFFAFLAISPDSVETGFGADYDLPKDSGWILDLYAEVQAAFFFHDSSAWYINFGTEEKRISARILSLFNATSYLMLSASGIAAGAGVTWGFDKSYAGGMVSASVNVYIEVGGRISFERPQIGGFALLGGSVSARLLFLSFYIALDTSLFVEAAKPFLVAGCVELSLSVTIGVWKFKKTITKNFKIQFTWEKSNAIDTDAVNPLNTTALPGNEPFGGLSMQSEETFKLVSFGANQPLVGDARFNDAVLPLDTWVDIEFKKGVLPDAVDGKIAGNNNPPEKYVDLIPPPSNTRQVRHEYRIIDIEIKASDGSGWVDYHPFLAMEVPDALIPQMTSDPASFPLGNWQKTGGEYNKIRLLSQTSLSLSQQGGHNIPEEFGVTSMGIFCEGEKRTGNCIDWLEVNDGVLYADSAWRQYQGALFRISGDDGVVLTWPSHTGIDKSLAFDTEAVLEIVFPEPCAELEIWLTTFSHSVEISLYRKSFASGVGEFEFMETQRLDQYQLLAPFRYTNITQPVSKIIIKSCLADDKILEDLAEEVEKLERRSFEDIKLSSGDREKLNGVIDKLKNEIDRRKRECCDPGAFDKEKLTEAIITLKGDLENCQQELEVAEESKQKACQEYSELLEAFNQCFKEPPAGISHEIFTAQKTDRTEYKFRLRDGETGKVVLKSAAGYPSFNDARKNIQHVLDQAQRKTGIQRKSSANKRFYFQVLDELGNVIAKGEETFPSARLRADAIKDFQGLVAANRPGARPPTQHHDQPNQPGSKDRSTCGLCKNIDLSGFKNCQELVAILRMIEDVYLDIYDFYYRELYFCAEGSVATQKEECERWEDTVDELTSVCEDIVDQIKNIQIFTDWLDRGYSGPPRERPCATLLHKICCLGWEDYQFNIHIPGQSAIEADFQATQAAITETLAAVWRPDTKYFIKIRYDEEVYDKKNNITQNHEFVHHFGFRTAGPLGLFHEDAHANYVPAGENPDQFALTSLRAYINYKRSYPNADGNLLKAKPLFYVNPRLLLFYTKNYTYRMFSDWPAYNGLDAIDGSRLQVVIKDPVEDVTMENPPPVITTEIPEAIVDWPVDPNPNIPPDILQLSYLRNPELLNALYPGSDCWVSGGDLIRPASLNTEIEVLHLKPQKLYTAIFNNIYKGNSRKVHQYVFQTSRYPDFRTQVESYRLSDGKGNTSDAFFHETLVVTNSDIDLGYEIITENLSPGNLALQGDWADPFERVLEGAWGVKPLNPPISTEFNILSQEGTNRVFSVLIRNPEPFNDPKIPDNELSKTIKVLGMGQTFKVLFSKDRSQALVMNIQKNITASDLDFRFQYIEWDGSDYAVVNIVDVGPIGMTP